MSTEKQPDILIFLSDQHHAGYAGFVGDAIVRTPHLDRIAESGTVFESAYTACPLCVPARTSFLTGHMPAQTGVYTNNGAIAEDHATFIHSIAAEGYDTVLCGRMHFMGEDQRHGFTKRIMGEITPLFWGRGGMSRQDLGPYVGTLGSLRSMEVVGGGNSPVLEYDRAVIDAALKYLAQDHDKPQCLVVGTYAPHHTFVAPPELYQYYRKIVSYPKQRASVTNYQHPILEHRKQKLTDELMLDVRAAYYGMIENLDNQIGMVHEAWQDYLQRNQRQGTFVYLADHGEQAGEHDFYGKETFYEGSAKIPMVFSGHGVKAQQRFKGAVSMLDIGPTLCNQIGASLPPQQSGKSLEKQLVYGTDELDRVVVSEFMERDQDIPGRMLRQEDWKLVSYIGHEEYDLLFHLKSDPHEMVNLKQQEPERYEQLKRMMTADWDVPQIIELHQRKREHHKLLSKWGAIVDVSETDRWPVPVDKLHMPE